jgi:hypothetical protein
MTAVSDQRVRIGRAEISAAARIAWSAFFAAAVPPAPAVGYLFVVFAQALGYNTYTYTY